MIDFAKLNAEADRRLAVGACGRKPFSTKEAAWSAAQRMQRTSGRYYQQSACSLCGHWHVIAGYQPASAPARTPPPAR